MTPDPVTVAVIVVACLYVPLSALWTWWQLRVIKRGLRLTSWDLEALAGALRKYWEGDR